MSGHNPHGRLGQPNPPWNHLQVPSFIPRQPQLAHLSNEPRPMNVRSSPLAWHTPAHTEAALYNYMTAATHKTPLDINPLLPAFVRPPNNTPFGSVDLSLGGPSSRNNSNTSPRNLSSPANAIESNFANNSLLQLSGQSTENNHQQSNCNGDNRGSVHSQLSAVPQATPFGQALPGTDMTLMMQHNSYHPILDSLQLVKEAIHNSLRQDSGDDTHELHELQRAVSAKSKTPTSNNIHSEPERFESAQRLPVSDPQFHPPQLTPTHQPSTNQRSPPTALNHSTSSCSSSSPSSSSSSASSSRQDLNQSVDTLLHDDKSQTRRRSRKPTKTTRMSNNSEEGELETNNCLTANAGNVSADFLMSEDLLAKSNHPKVHENGTNKSSWEDSEPITASDSAFVEAEIVAKPATPPNDLNTEQPPQHPPERRKSPTPPTAQPSHDDNETIDNIAAELAKTCHENGPKSWEPVTPVNAGSFALTPVTIPLVPISLTDNHIVSVGSTQQPIIENGVDTKSSHSPSKANGKSPAKANANDVVVLPSEAIFKEVENKLEEMFAGIEDDRPTLKTANNPSTPTKASTSSSKPSPKKTSTPKTVQQTPAAAKKKRRKPQAKKTPAASTSKGSRGGKKGNAKKTKATSKSNAPDKKGKKDTGATSAGADSTKPVAVVRSGPIVHVDHSGSTHVINGPVTEEVTEIKAKLKKGFIVGHHHPAGHASDRSKIRGLHLSTLSTKYDADTTDTTWMCVFCKMGPHRLGLGDLFGPYIVSTACDEFQLSQSDPTDDLFSGHHKEPGKHVQKRSLPVVAAGSSNSKKKRKLNESLPSSPPPTDAQSPAGSSASNPSPFFGMAKASETSFEVWMHGDCAVWSSGVHIIGTRIVGLEAAVWTASGHRCVMCQQYGAMLSCLQRGCNDEVHVPCARLASWQLCEDDFKSRCSTHSVKVEMTASTSANSS